MDGVDLPPESPLRVFTARERPDLWKQSLELFQDVWPEYNLHANNSGQYFGRLYPEHAGLQVLVHDEAADVIVGRGRAIAFRWDESMADLPAGIDAAGLRAVTEEAAPTAVCALAAEVDTGRQGQGLSRIVLAAMAAATRNAGLRRLVAPVRPSHKDRYPLIPIDAYARWQRADGLPFDPWMRVHARLGATILRTEPRSMQIDAPVADWEQWTGLELPAPGQYTFPGGLAPLAVTDGIGRYWEPNVWMLHP
jgi:GNAT superfamily N-acetyltransferase